MDDKTTTIATTVKMNENRFSYHTIKERRLDLSGVKPHQQLASQPNATKPTRFSYSLREAKRRHIAIHTMVRHKTRWILVELKTLEQEEGLGRASVATAAAGAGGTDTTRRKNSKRQRRQERTTVHTMMAETSSPGGFAGNDAEFPTKNDFTARLRRTIDMKYGPVDGGPISADLQVRFFDLTTQLVLIRVARHYVGFVTRSLSTLLTKKRLLAMKEGEEFGGQGQGVRIGPAFRTADVLARVVSIHGSARTAKIGTVKKLKDIYRAKLLKQQQQQIGGSNGGGNQLSSSSSSSATDHAGASNRSPKQTTSKTYTIQQKDTCRQFHTALQSVLNID